MFTFLAVFDGIIVGMIVFYLIDFLFDDKPSVILSKLISGIVFGVTYFLLCSRLNYSETATKIGVTTACSIFFGPVILISILWVINYTFKRE